MNWFRQNRFLAAFLAKFSLAALITLCFLIREKEKANHATAHLEGVTNELTRLRRASPFPNDKNVRQVKVETLSYRDSLASLESELKGRMLPILPCQPNEFQAQLRLAVNRVEDEAAKARVKLPAHFHLGFDDYASSLPSGEAAPPLGRQLRAVEWIARIMVESHIDSLGNLTRTPLPEEKDAGPAMKPVNPRDGFNSNKASQAPVSFSALDISFSASPIAARRVINQIAACPQQVYVIRTLRVLNQVGKGPKRGGSAETTPTSFALAAKSSPASKVPKENGITFIVGTEHLDLAARIEILSFSFPEQKSR